MIVVCGPSGSGKSTLIKCVNALEPFQKGDIVVDGTSIADPKTNLPKLRSRVGMVFQHFELFPHLTITENLTIAQIKVLGRSKAEATKKGLELLERVGLSAHAHKHPGQLSGGQQQRVAIARALAMDPVVMLISVRRRSQPSASGSIQPRVCKMLSPAPWKSRSMLWRCQSAGVPSMLKAPGRHSKSRSSG